MRRGLVPGIVFLRYTGVPPVFSFGGRDVREPSLGHLKQKTEYVVRIPS